MKTFLCLNHNFVLHVVISKLFFINNYYSKMMCREQKNVARQKVQVTVCNLKLGPLATAKTCSYLAHDFGQHDEVLKLCGKIICCE